MTARARFGALFGMVLAAVGSGAPAEPIKTDSGFVDGVEVNSVRVFKAIPFAAPPVGVLRWRAPQPVPTWSRVRKAEKFGPACPQVGSYPPESPPEPMSEDCLYLNVWTPASMTREKLPVMVWIYGGSLQNGSASTPLYSGDRLGQRNVILVTVNYRLGALGFLALQALGKESGTGRSGNYGLLDQIAALQWVHRNIGAFGGDPERVTVFGQSSGSISVSALVTSPLTKGLFQRAIGESGGLFEPVNLDPGFWPAGADKQGEEFAARIGAPTLARLRQLSTAELFRLPFNAHFVIDGFVLKKPPFDVYRDGEQNDVDLLVGSNADEGQLFLAGKSVTVDNFSQILSADFPKPIVWLMRPKPGASNSEARASAAAFEGDMRFRWDMWTWARLAADAGRKKVFFYQFSRTPPFPSGNRYFGMRATHGMEMPYVFDHLDQQVLPWTPQDRTLASVISAYWTNFATSGDPNGPGLPKWPDFRTSQRQLMLLGEQIRAAPIPYEHQLQSVNRVYTGIRFATRHRYSLLATAAIMVVAVIAGGLIAVRRWRRRSRTAEIRA